MGEIMLPYVRSILFSRMTIRLAVVALLGVLLFAPTPAHGATCPTFTQPNSISLQVTYGRCALTPVTVTIVPGCSAADWAWEITAIDGNGNVVPMPAWISFDP